MEAWKKYIIRIFGKENSGAKGLIFKTVGNLEIFYSNRALLS
jgi:hypothetical protein